MRSNIYTARFWSQYPGPNSRFLKISVSRLIQGRELLRIFAPIDEIKQAVLNAARIEDHAERAGFRRGRYGRWHSAFREDKNPSCTIRDRYITDWGRYERWNVIDLEMLATGQPFMRALRTLASEYGIRVESQAYDPSTANRKALDRQETHERVFNWRAGFLELTDEILAEEKAKLCDPAGMAANESLILSLTGLERAAREARSERFLVGAYDAFRQFMPALAHELADYGERQRYERHAELMAFIDLMADAEERW